MAFCFYDRSRGFDREIWMSPEGYLKYRLNNCCKNAKCRAAKKQIEFELDVDYLHSIYPADGRCPVFGTPMVWGTADRWNSPSLDRLDPAKGYVRGNVSFMSSRANIIKSDASLHEIEKVVTFLKQATAESTILHGRD